MLSKPILHNAIGKWALALTKFTLSYAPLIVMKGQVIVDFLANYFVDDDKIE